MEGFPSKRCNYIKKYRIGNKQLCKNAVRLLERYCGKAVTLIRNQENSACGERLNSLYIKGNEENEGYFVMLFRQLKTFCKEEISNMIYIFLKKGQKSLVVVVRIQIKY